MRKERLSLARSRRALDTAALGYVGLLLLLTLTMSFRLHEWQWLTSRLLVAGTLYAVAVVSLRRLASSIAAAALHTGAVMILFSFLFNITGEFQQVFYNGWMDSTLIAWEKALLGVEASVFLQRVTHPVLTEWMMFSYVIYIPMLPLVALACYRSAGLRAMTDYLLNLSLAYIVCYLGFIVYPVAGPLCYYPDQFTIPLDGGFFTWCGEWVRSNVHYPGGCLPSPHCAAGTVMILMLFWYHRRLFIRTLPVLLTIDVATVYGRYHYLSDSVSGVVVAVLVVALSPAFARGLDRVTVRAKQFLGIGSEVGPVPE
jgi:membrane-associated phospholipid phosphatase